MGEPLTHGRAREVLAVFLRLGLTAFGGPTAHIALFRGELVRRRGWLDDAELLELVGAASVIPGPNSTELAIAIGRRRAGWAGFAAAGAGFILPAVTIVLALAWLYREAGARPELGAVLAGVEPVLIAILAAAVVGLGRTMAGDRPRLALAAGAAILYVAGIAELAILGAGAITLVALRGLWPPGRSALFGLGVGGGLAGGSAVGLVPLFLVFLKAGALLFGSGYVLVAFLRADLVGDLGWLTEGQLLDAIAIGQLTPGPLFTSATFIGYLLAGLPGAAVATVGIFLPSFVFVAFLDPIVHAVRGDPRARAALDGVAAAALGLMTGVTLLLASHALAPDGRPDAAWIAVAVAAGGALATRRLGATTLIGLGALAGLVRLAVGA